MSAFVRPSVSAMALRVAVSVRPTCAAPETPGWPVAAKLPSRRLTVTSWPSSQEGPEGRSSQVYSPVPGPSDDASAVNEDEVPPRMNTEPRGTKAPRSMVTVVLPGVNSLRMALTVQDPAAVLDAGVVEHPV